MLFNVTRSPTSKAANVTLVDQEWRHWKIPQMTSSGNPRAMNFHAPAFARRWRQKARTRYPGRPRRSSILHSSDINIESIGSIQQRWRRWRHRRDSDANWRWQAKLGMPWPRIFQRVNHDPAFGLSLIYRHGKRPYSHAVSRRIGVGLNSTTRVPILIDEMLPDDWYMVAVVHDSWFLISNDK